ncbi:hypothetical protein A3C21_01530 [Candidatus Kaiserbacteria bacterium RIFCSPHIGHO2_02_FULL_59_21]|uniref:Uncharacterized protein n=1 Tax=Candidatus Kaiserbacteria bacterium RIFCSPHIGHO2_02_FULL_59_21 TaxID=1798500 RepID=A0A1F6E1Z8_9BACT|nr:MAG: hypothetical protein A2766_00640 [Candidatus Kaiserbacteria bacterium RIFCSPHIGHO2_01_FULL_58_22]OGG67550.1 MAG: hypothetical protein A3C21_01530 [Candidatus Kaiserbacteria bacterium RIFCSPHIGHO2_02_FULL_59_21]OGG80154.1 MAG: hypothetical protein A2952_03660 [Candidatus Kaiserbacteria bacterium RIFCSPLOWO2_01_FULL_59_34]OGG86945.1 MAG: hypothetical protein A3I47_03050 [Candidatus Kaiserbacteria bacterium RIFCSPLOWO2_02_FULL_59_19]HCM68067.1 hypothetical protein [Candidatus Kerfeldbacter
MSTKQLQISVIAALLLIGGAYYFSATPRTPLPRITDEILAAKFDVLSKRGNSSCSAAFADSIDTMADTARFQGSCCSPMDTHRYEEQITGLTKFKDIPDIPTDPYDIDAGLAKMFKDYYDVELTPEEQTAYDYAIRNSNEKGPCCCKCWRWYVYGGLGKLLIQKYGFTGEQVTQVWDLSDGCGGEGEHVNH